MLSKIPQNCKRDSNNCLNNTICAGPRRAPSPGKSTAQQAALCFWESARLRSVLRGIIVLGQIFVSVHSILCNPQLHFSDIQIVMLAYFLILFPCTPQLCQGSFYVLDSLSVGFIPSCCIAGRWLLAQAVFTLVHSRANVPCGFAQHSVYLQYRRAT